MHDLQMADTRQ